MSRRKTKPAKRRALGGKRRLEAPGHPLPAPLLPFPVVGVGASAGGLEASTALLKELPDDAGMAMVVVQHLDPHHKSLLRELLSRVTNMPVAQVEDGVVPEMRHVYVIPPDKDVTMRDGVLRLSSRQQTGGRHLPIDRFLTSLAEDRKGAAIGVILSGTGSDGAAGLRAIRSEGGIAMAQDPSSAQHPGMPQSAIASGCVDLILPPAEIAREIVRLARSPHVEWGAAQAEAEAPPKGGEDLQSILQTLSAVSDIDFALYKTATIRRQAARRMALRRIGDVQEYAAYLQENPAEAQALCQDVLIHVTGFFRDPEAFAALETTVFPKLVAGKPQNEPIRIWVPGCATGEEAYSIAIALSEFVGKQPDDSRCQIFATDVSAASVDKARLGIYPEAAVSEISPARLRRFFVKVGDSYQIGKPVRDLCVFARHDLGKDPPFSRLDLISCRNVLIYLGPVLQQRVLSVFHYAL